MQIIYEHPLSPYAQKLKIALREKQVPFDARLPEGMGTGNSQGEFAAASPRGEVPAFIHDGHAIFDSTIILEYIEDVWPTPPMLPGTALERARVRMIEEVMDTHVEAIGWGLGELYFFNRADDALKQDMLAKTESQLADYFSWLEKELADREWFTGHFFGWADLSVIPYLNAFAGFNLKPQPDTRLADWFTRANDRPSVILTEAESRASVTVMSGIEKAIEQGLFKRQYRDHRLEWMIKTGGLEVVLKGLKTGSIRFTETFKA